MLEKDIERAYIKWTNAQEDHHVIGSQVKLPLGKLDVLTFINDGWPCVIISEIKRGGIDEKACTQLLGYMHQVKWLLESAFPGGIDTAPLENIHCLGWLVGADINEMTARVVKSFGMGFVQHSIVNGKIEFLHWPEYSQVLDDHRISPALLAAGKLLHKSRVSEKIAVAQGYGGDGRFGGTLYDEHKFNFESLKRTVPYWSRKA